MAKTGLPVSNQASDASFFAIAMMSSAGSDSVRRAVTKTPDTTDRNSDIVSGLAVM
jgi:hypothetical protein